MTTTLRILAPVLLLSLLGGCKTLKPHESRGYSYYHYTVVEGDTDHHHHHHHHHAPERTVHVDHTTRNQINNYVRVVQGDDGRRHEHHHHQHEHDFDRKPPAPEMHRPIHQEHHGKSVKARRVHEHHGG